MLNFDRACSSEISELQLGVVKEQDENLHLRKLVALALAERQIADDPESVPTVPETSGELNENAATESSFLDYEHMLEMDEVEVAEEKPKKPKPNLMGPVLHESTNDSQIGSWVVPDPKLPSGSENPLPCGGNLDVNIPR